MPAAVDMGRVNGGGGKGHRAVVICLFVAKPGPSTFRRTERLQTETSHFSLDRSSQCPH